MECEVAWSYKVQALYCQILNTTYKKLQQFVSSGYYQKEITCGCSHYLFVDLRCSLYRLLIAFLHFNSKRCICSSMLWSCNTLLPSPGPAAGKWIWLWPLCSILHAAIHWAGTWEASQERPFHGEWLSVNVLTTLCFVCLTACRTQYFWLIFSTFFLLVWQKMVPTWRGFCITDENSECASSVVSWS
jgi:hypothetical protein